MTFAGFCFISLRFWQIITLLPTLSMLAYFVNAYTKSNVLTPTFILVLFIVSVLGAVWAIATLLMYTKSRRSGLFVAFVDLCFVGSFIAGVYLLRNITRSSCTNFTAGSFYFDLGILGYAGRNSGNKWSFNVNKNCAMLKASFAFGIMNCVFFFLTFLFALSIGKHYEEKHTVVEKRRTRRSSSHHHGSRSPRRSHHSHRGGFV